MNIWKVTSARMERTIKALPELTRLCTCALESMWLISDKCGQQALKRGKELPPYQQFVSIYFQRNIIYLSGAYLLACDSLCEPSRDLQRTIYETILRGYFFIAKREEADLMYSLIEGTIRREERAFLRGRKFWSINLMLGEMYTEKTRKAAKKLYGDVLSRSSHPSIRGAFIDIKYSLQTVKDCLNMILALSYGNIQMMAEAFFNFLSDELKNKVKTTMRDIAEFHTEVAIFEPDKRGISSKIKLKKGNFMEVLRID